VQQTLQKRIEYKIARFMFGLSPSAKRRLLRKPVRVDGQTLDPEIQLLLLLRKLGGGGTLRSTSPERARVNMRRDTLQFAGEPVQLGAVRDFTIPGAAGPLRVRHYAPEEGGVRPLLVFFHGGGYVTGDLDTHDRFCRLLCRHGGFHVLAVEYRLAPEHPFPAAVEDGLSSFAWAKEHAAELGADPVRVGVGGDSAGGNMAAVVSILTKQENRATPSLQVLIYPAADRSFDRASVGLFREGFLLEQADMRWYDGHYFGATDVPRTDPRISPMYAESLDGVAPALIFTAGFDPLRDEGEAFGSALRAAGTRADVRRFDGFVHGFINMTMVSPVTTRAVVEIAEAVCRAFE
jgi:acetyl esterase